MKLVLNKLLTSFTEAMADDLNISVALAALFEAVREINILCDAGKVSEEEARSVLKTLASIDTVLHVIPLSAKEDPIPQDLLEALEKRQTARSEKNWKESDHYRDLILSRGYIIEDTPLGARLKKQRKL